MTTHHGKPARTGAADRRAERLHHPQPGVGRGHDLDAMRAGAAQGIPVNDAAQPPLRQGTVTVGLPETSPARPSLAAVIGLAAAVVAFWAVLAVALLAGSGFWSGLVMAWAGAACAFVVGGGCWLLAEVREARLRAAARSGWPPEWFDDTVARPGLNTRPGRRR